VQKFTKEYLLLGVGEPERQALRDEGGGVAKLGEVGPIGRHLVRQLLLRLSQGHVQQGQIEQVGCNRDSEFTKYHFTLNSIPFLHFFWHDFSHIFCNTSLPKNVPLFCP
jgi:hypothetical protein